MKRIISMLLVLTVFLSVVFSIGINSNAATCIFPYNNYPSVKDSSNTCTATLTGKKTASVYVWAYSASKGVRINTRMLDGSTKRVIWSEKNSFALSKVYMYGFYQGGRTYNLGTNHKSYKLQFSSGSNICALYVKNPKNCKIY